VPPKEEIPVCNSLLSISKDYGKKGGCSENTLQTSFEEFLAFILPKELCLVSRLRVVPFTKLVGLSRTIDLCIGVAPGLGIQLPNSHGITVGSTPKTFFSTGRLGDCSFPFFAIEVADTEMRKCEVERELASGMPILIEQMNRMGLNPYHIGMTLRGQKVSFWVFEGENGGMHLRQLCAIKLINQKSCKKFAGMMDLLFGHFVDRLNNEWKLSVKEPTEDKEEQPTEDKEEQPTEDKKKSKKKKKKRRRKEQTQVTNS